MKHSSRATILTLGLTLALPLALLGACGRTEPVVETPSAEELAAAANAAAANAIAAQQADEGAANLNYVNAAHGFSVTFPEGWTMDKGASTDDGVVFEDPGAGADVRVFWQEGKGERTIQQIVEGLTSGSEGVDGDFVNDTEYRGTANDGEGNNVAVRLLRKPDGSVVTATFVYPEMLSEQYSAIAQAVLDSLTLTSAPGQAAATNATEASNATASNATE